MLARVLRPRVLIYGAALLLLSAAFVWSLGQRQDLLIDVLKDRNVLARQVEDGQIENVYRLQLINRTERTLRLELDAAGLPGLQLIRQNGNGRQLELPPAAILALPVQLRLPPQGGLASGAHVLSLVPSHHNHALGERIGIVLGAEHVVAFDAG